VLHSFQGGDGSGITTANINGRKPPQLTAQTLMRLTPRLPTGWAEQRKLLGFR
jgi:hypothetical protein